MAKKSSAKSDLPEEIREETRTSSLIVFNYIQKYVFPVYQFADKNVPQLVGSGFLINYKNYLLFVTAGHVHDLRTPERPLFYYIGQDRVVYLTGPFITTRSESLDRADDNQDFAVYYVDPSRNRPLLDALHKDIPADMIATNSRIITDCKYFVAGFPLTRFRPDKANMEINPNVFLWSGRPASDVSYERENVSSETNIMVRFRKNNTVNAETGLTGYTNLKPRGISGGCVWAAYGYRDSLRRLIIDDIKLVGLVTLHSASEKALLCTRIDKVLEFADILINIQESK